MVIIGIDPGSIKTGYGVIETSGNRLKIKSYGVVRTKPKQTVFERLETIYNGVARVIALDTPEAAAVEEVFYHKNVKSILTLGQARGCALLALQQAGVPISEYSPRKVKQGVTGSGAASKEQVQFMIKKLFAVKEKEIPEDAADALAIALCHSHNLALNIKRD